VWTSLVEPESAHDVTAARTHALPALYRLFDMTRGEARRDMIFSLA